MSPDSCMRAMIEAAEANEGQWLEAPLVSALDLNLSDEDGGQPAGQQSVPSLSRDCLHAPYCCDNLESDNLVQAQWAFVDARQLIQLEASGQVRQAFYHPAVDPEHNRNHNSNYTHGHNHSNSHSSSSSSSSNSNSNSSNRNSNSNSNSINSSNSHNHYQQQLQLQLQPLQHVHFEQNSLLDRPDQGNELGLDADLALGLADCTKISSHKDQHNEIERRRRFRIKDSCDLLKTMVPGLMAKTDKARVLEQTVRYVRHLHSCPDSRICQCRFS